MSSEVPHCPNSGTIAQLLAELTSFSHPVRKFFSQEYEFLENTFIYLFAVARQPPIQGQILQFF
jgi:hypothetical protein